MHILKHLREMSGYALYIIISPLLEIYGFYLINIMFKLTTMEEIEIELKVEDNFKNVGYTYV